MGFVVREKGLTAAAAAWEEIIKLLNEHMVRFLRLRGDQLSSVTVVLESSFHSLATRKEEELIMMAVMAPRTIASCEVLKNLWELQVR